MALKDNNTKGIGFRKSVLGLIASLFILIVFVYISVKLIQKFNYNSEISPESVEYSVVKVIDGDTIDVLKDNVTSRVRIIGIDSPEYNNGKSECFYSESTEFAKELLHGKKVELKRDYSQDNKDKYGRLLRHVFVDGKSFGEQSIGGGYSNEYTFKYPYQDISLYKISERSAKEKKLGVWSPECQNKP